MNIFHRWCCASKGWARTVQEYMMPGVVGDKALGDDVLEIGPGPGLTTDWLRERVPHLTAVEIDVKLARSLKARLKDTNVTVVHGDATRMPFPDDSFTSALCFTMLHHVPSSARHIIGEIRKLTPKPVRYVINTHWHSDHHYGNIAYREAFPGVEFIQHAETRRAVIEQDIPVLKGNVDSAYPAAAENLRQSLRSGKSASGAALTDAQRRLEGTSGPSSRTRSSSPPTVADGVR